MTTDASAEPPPRSGDKPVGTGGYVVPHAEGLSSIAERHGLFWQTIWEHPNNDALRRARDNPEVLLPGDRVFIPPIRTKTEACATDRRHVFRKRGIPIHLVLTVRDRRGQPFASCRYLLEVASERHEGNTDGEGRVRHFVHPFARTGRLTVWPARARYPETLSWELHVSALAPIESIAGVRARLMNLGLPAGAPGGPLDDADREALRAFQYREGLDATGEPDDPTRRRLLEVHGS